MVLEMDTYQGLYQKKVGEWEAYQTKPPYKRFTGLTPEAVLDVLAQDTQEQTD